MKRPVRPVALLILTLCALYPCLSAVFQGLYPWVTGQEFALMGQTGTLATMAAKIGMPVWLPNIFKALVGLAFLGAVPGLWAGDGRAMPLAFIGMKSPLDQLLMEARREPTIPAPIGLHPRHPNGFVLVREQTWTWLLDQMSPDARAHYAAWPTI